MGRGLDSNKITKVRDLKLRGSPGSYLLKIGTTLASLSTIPIEDVPTELADGSWVESHQYQNSAGVFGQIANIPDCEGNGISARRDRRQLLVQEHNSRSVLIAD